MMVPVGIMFLAAVGIVVATVTKTRVQRQLRADKPTDTPTNNWAKVHELHTWLEAFVRHYNGVVTQVGRAEVGLVPIERQEDEDMRFELGEKLTICVFLTEGHAYVYRYDAGNDKTVCFYYYLSGGFYLDSFEQQILRAAIKVAGV